MTENELLFYYAFWGFFYTTFDVIAYFFSSKDKSLLRPDFILQLFVIRFIFSGTLFIALDVMYSQTLWEHFRATGFIRTSTGEFFKGSLYIVYAFISTQIYNRFFDPAKGTRIPAERAVEFLFVVPWIRALIFFGVSFVGLIILGLASLFY